MTVVSLIYVHINLSGGLFQRGSHLHMFFDAILARVYRDAKDLPIWHSSTP